MSTDLSRRNFLCQPLRQLLGLSLCSAILPVEGKTLQPIQRQHRTTNWRVMPSFIFDTLCLLSTLVGDPFYLTYYRREYENLEPKFTPEVRQALASLKRQMKDEHQLLIGPSLCWLFSLTNDRTLADLLRTVDDGQAMQSALHKLNGHNEDFWQAYLPIRSDLRTIFHFLQDIGFENYWRQSILPGIRTKIKTLNVDLARYNVIAADEAYLGFALPSDTITVYLLYFNQPHGLRVAGQRFCTGVAYPAEIVLRNAVHELMHPPFRPSPDPTPQKLAEMWKAVELLKTDEFLMDRVNHHNPSFGYNSFAGYIEEDCVQALEQMSSERLQFAMEPHKRWKASDDGMHVFAVALYSVLKEEGHDAQNEEFSDFLTRMVRAGKLGPGQIRLRYERFYAEPGHR
jgi:hypothetical protein